MGLSVGIKLGSHEIVSPLGAGGMGEVYRSDMRVRRDLAVKDLPLNRSTHGPQTGFTEIRSIAAFKRSDKSPNRTRTRFVGFTSTSGAFKRHLNSQLNLDGAHATEKLRRN
jgi:hypothetical protein